MPENTWSISKRSYIFGLESSAARSQIISDDFFPWFFLLYLRRLFFSLLLMVFFVFFYSPFLKQSTLFACKKYYNTPPARSNACIFAFHPHLNIAFFCIIFRDSQRFFFDINIFSTSFSSFCSLRFFIVRYLSLVLSTSLSRVTHFPVLKSPFPAILSLSPIITSPSPILISPYPALVSSFLAPIYFSPVSPLLRSLISFSCFHVCLLLLLSCFLLLLLYLLYLYSTLMSPSPCSQVSLSGAHKPFSCSHLCFSCTLFSFSFADVFLTNLASPFLISCLLS